MRVKDRKSIGVTPRTSDVLQRLTSFDWFPEAQDAAHFCLAYAIKEKVPPGTTEGVETRWTISLFDATGEIRMLIDALYPECETPVRLIEHLVNEGLLLLEERLASPDVSPADLLAEYPIG